MDVERKLEDLGLVLPGPKPPLGAYVPYLSHERLIFISGQGPVLASGSAICGRLGDDLDLVVRIGRQQRPSDPIGEVSRRNRILYHYR